MNKQRRKFLQIGGMLGVGAALFPYEIAARSAEIAKLSKFGLQLYSVKEEMAKDAAGTMRKLAGFGYKQFEGFDGGKGILWGMTPAECKSLLSDIGVDFISSHADVFKNLDEQAEQAAEVGMKYLICPYIGAQNSVEEWKNISERFNKAGATLESHGLKFAYHNHDYTCHVKDAEPDGGDAHDRGVLLGAGEMPYAEIIKKSKKYGMEYFVVEQERFVGTTPLKAAEANAVYLSKLKVQIR